MRVGSIATLLVAVAGAVASPTIARADTGTLPNGMTVSVTKLLIHENDSTSVQIPSNAQEATWHYFNMAHCQCAKDSTDSDFHEGTFELEYVPANATSTLNRPATFWTGAACDTLTTRPMTCFQTSTMITSLADMQRDNRADPEFNIYDLINATTETQGEDCQVRQGDSTVWFTVDGEGDGMDDYFSPYVINTDTQPPVIPTGFNASGGENAIDITWDAPIDTSDIYYYQAFCATADGSAAATTNSRPAPRYVTSRSLCGLDANDPTLTGIDIDTTDLPDPQEVDTAATGLAQLDSAFLCGESSSPTADSLKIGGLTNGQNYQVAIYVMDKFGNASGVFFKELLTPVSSTDFWEDIHGRGSKVQGGLCAVDGGGAGSLVLVFGALGIVVVRRRRQRRGGGGGAVVGLVLVVGMLGTTTIARADDAGGYDPFWNEPDAKSGQAGTTVDDHTVNWHVGVRLGPYTPQIDAQAGTTSGAPGPYKQMFGGYSILPMLDVDYVLWSGFGQVTVGGNVGFMSKKAHSYTDTSMPTDDPRPRAPSDSNTFRLIPFAATVGYRFTVLDDDYGIPVVPYAKLGLAYDVWWMKAPSGDLSKVCTDGSTTDAEMGCPTTRAFGGSFGVQATIGIAVRAERVDMQAARAMQESGIEHAGFYAELQAAKVDGFGSAKKLAVGDNTWFAGVDFEF